MLVALLATMVLGLPLFKPSRELVYDRDDVLAKQKALGGLTSKEIRTIVWLVIAIVLWLTVSGDYIGWVTLAIGVALSLPIIGEVLTPASWNSVDVKSLMFLTAAMAIGSVGGATGMNTWIADVVLPSSVPENIYLLALLIAARSSEYRRLDICTITVQDGPSQVMGDIATSCMGSVPLGGGKYAVVWANRWAYIIGDAYMRNSSYPSDYYSLDEASEIVDLQTGGAYTYIEIRDDMVATDRASDLLFSSDLYLQEVVVNAIEPR